MINHSFIKLIIQSISMMTCGALVFAQVPNQAVEQLKILQQHINNPQDVGPDKIGRQYAANDTNDIPASKPKVSDNSSTKCPNETNAKVNFVPPFIKQIKN